MTPPELPGLLTAGQLRATAEHIASQQLPHGLIPWFAGHYGDPWDHIEGAMALTVCGLLDEARLAFDWSARHQAADGTWPMETVDTLVTESSVDANQCAYIAVGVWHDWLITGDRAFVDTMWPVVRSAINFVCSMQQPGGAISWARDPAGVVNPDTLLTGSSSMVMSLRCAMALADLVGDPQPEWELAVARLAHAVAVHPSAFQDQSRWSMEWYYPVLGGAVRGRAGLRLIDSRWDEFVLPGRGVRCVSDRQWITAAETCELVLSLDALGDRARAWQLMRDVQKTFRADTGGYWTGWVWPEDVHWPPEQSTWTSAAVILAADTLAEHSPAHAIFRGDALPRLIELECDETCHAPLGAASD